MPWFSLVGCSASFQRSVYELRIPRLHSHMAAVAHIGLDTSAISYHWLNEGKPRVNADSLVHMLTDLLVEIVSSTLPAVPMLITGTCPPSRCSLVCWL